MQLSSFVYDMVKFKMMYFVLSVFGQLEFNPVFDLFVIQAFKRKRNVFGALSLATKGANSKSLIFEKSKPTNTQLVEEN